MVLSLVPPNQVILFLLPQYCVVLSYSLCQSYIILSFLPQNVMVLPPVLQNRVAPYLLQSHMVYSFYGCRA